MENSEEDQLIFSINPDQLPFITGIAPSYSEKYDKDKLSRYIGEKEFRRGVSRINNSLITYWPCDTCYYGCGFLFGYLTCGLTCIFPCIMISKAKEQMLCVIERVNQEIFIPNGIYLKYKQTCMYISKIEVRTASKSVKSQNQNRL